jgi:cyclopropane fatty-acyl-phospholipid synthase-like methyltransferase
VSGTGNFRYVGDELELFQHAQNWKQYFACKLSGYLGENVLEVGAGNGATTEVLISGSIKKWLCLEPDSGLASLIHERISQDPKFKSVRVQQSTLEELHDEQLYDSILYLDVLEHIEDDEREVNLAYNKLRSGGRLIILAPAHRHLYSQFDSAIGHYRRYSKAQLSALIKRKGFEVEKSMYLDSLGYFLSLGNRIIAKQSRPSIKQIKFWDKFVVPLSKLVDMALWHRAGRSVLTVGKK